MLGRRKATNSEKFINLAERVRQRAMGSRPAITRQPANDGGRLAQRRNAAESRPRPPGRSATVLSFDETPIYRVVEDSVIKTSLLHQVLAVLEDRLDCVPYLDGSRETLQAAVDELIDETLADLELNLGQAERRALIARLLDELAGLGPLELLLADDTVNEIVVNDLDQVFVQRRGRRQRTDVAFRSQGHLLRTARRIALGAGQRLDEAHPIADVRLAGGHRACVVVPPRVPEGASITISKRTLGDIPLLRMVRLGSLSRDMGMLLALAVGTRRNILISGAGGSGRTTLLNALLETADPGQRIVTIEAFAELRLPGRHAVRLETRPPSAAGAGAVNQRDLLLGALRMRPDRIILGELQDDEAFEFLQALDSGHRGAMATIQAASPEDALKRLETMMGASGAGAVLGDGRALIARAIDLVVHVELMGDGVRRVTKVTEVVGVDVATFVTRDLFRFEQAGENGDGGVVGTFRETGAKPAFTERFGRREFGAPLDSTF